MRNGENRASFLTLTVHPFLTRIGVIAKVLPVLTASVPTLYAFFVSIIVFQSKKF